MTESSDRFRERRFSGTVRDELARLRGKKLGVCAACGRPVFVTQDFTRATGRVVHLRCSISVRTASPMPLVVDGLVVRHLIRRDR